MRRLRNATIAVLLAACGAPDAPVNTGPSAAQGDDLPLGDTLPEDDKADGQWGDALKCKAIPSLPGLVSPKITISLNGLTLHLVDAATGYDKVFPIGPGAIDQKQTEPEYLESLSYRPVISSGKHDFTIIPKQAEPCKTWWTDPDTGTKKPVFAGLPFMSWSGNYAIHGPIDNFTAPSGGNLRRGFVSHGCVRLQAADILEVYARVKGVASVPVHVQREPERDAGGRAVDVPQRWVGSECVSDGDCNYTNGFCKQNRYSGRGFCSAHCTASCADRAGAPTTFCVADPDNSAVGICVPQVAPQDFACRPFDHLVSRGASRFRQPTVRATVCVPGSPGWVGDHCFAASECQMGTTCAGAANGKFGICTEACQAACPDLPGWPWTFCAKDPSLGATCMRQCTPASGASECPASSDCLPRTRNGDPATTKYVCVPRK